jgi:hypothetical protein
MQISNIGKLQWQTFNQDWLKGLVSIMSPLAKNKLPLFSFRPVKQSQKGQILKLCEFKTDCELFSHPFIACQSRDGDLDEYFYIMGTIRIHHHSLIVVICAWVLSLICLNV